MRYIHIKNNSIEIVNSTRSKAKLKKLKKWTGTIIESESSIEDLITAGMIIVPADRRYNATTQTFDLLDTAEQYAAGLITIADYRKYVKAQRKSRYVQESDPIFMEQVFEEIANGEPRDCADWIAAVNEIKTELPLP